MLRCDLYWTPESRVQSRKEVVRCIPAVDSPLFRNRRADVHRSGSMPVSFDE
jgi:hypothetical protein